MSSEIDESLPPEAVFALGDLMRALGRAVDLPDPLAPSALRPVLDEALAAYDRYLAARLTRIPVRCGRGCAACCRDNPRGVSGVELLRVLQAVEALPDAEALRAAVRARAARYQERLDRLGDADAAVSEGKRLDDPCALLGPDGACRVYADRPLACRMFFSITEPAWCAGAHPRHAEARNPHLPVPPVALLMLDDLSARLGLGALPRDLSRGLAALSDSAARRSST